MCRPLDSTEAAPTHHTTARRSPTMTGFHHNYMVPRVVSYMCVCIVYTRVHVRLCADSRIGSPQNVATWYRPCATNYDSPRRGKEATGGGIRKEPRRQPRRRRRRRRPRWLRKKKKVADRRGEVSRPSLAGVKNAETNRYSKPGSQRSS